MTDSISALVRRTGMPTSGSIGDRRSQGPYRLALCLPLVFLIGVSGTIAARIAAYVYHPEKFVNDSPSISATAASPPGSVILEWALIATALCITVSWTLALIMSRDRIAALGQARRPGVLLWLLAVGSWALGVNAGLSLALLGVFNMGDHHDSHMAFSYAFYISQVSSFLVDGALAVAIRRADQSIAGPAERFALVGKVVMAGMVLIAALFFFYMYISKDYAAADVRFTVQKIYVASEYTVALLSFAYPLISFAEIRRHFRVGPP
jgi:hypothetical membrane protein